jgi:hypothetical protein
MLPLRKWETGRFVELGKRLLAADDRMGIVVTGAPSEAESAREVARQLASDRVVCLAGKTSLRELLVLYGLADVLVTNDSGPGHFASMTNIQSIVLFGPETPALFGPIGGRGKILYANLACSPCVNVFTTVSPLATTTAACRPSRGGGIPCGAVLYHRQGIMTNEGGTAQKALILFVYPWSCTCASFPSCRSWNPMKGDTP